MQIIFKNTHKTHLGGFGLLIPGSALCMSVPSLGQGWGHRRSCGGGTAAQGDAMAVQEHQAWF